MVAEKTISSSHCSLCVLTPHFYIYILAFKILYIRSYGKRNNDYENKFLKYKKKKELKVETTRNHPKNMVVLMCSHLVILACLYGCEHLVYKILFPDFSLKFYPAFSCWFIQFIYNMIGLYSIQLMVHHLFNRQLIAK